MPASLWTDPVVLAFVLIPVALVTAWLQCVRVASQRLGEPYRARQRAVVVTAIVAAAWMAVTWIAASSGVLRMWDATPPPFAILVVAIAALAVLIAYTGYGTRLAAGLPLWALVGFQAFRLPLELAMHEMSRRGVMPVQMSYSGRNFDILTGVSAIAVAWLVATRRAGRRLVMVWNLAGLALLGNVVTIAVLSTPRFRYFGNDRLNVWVADPPFVWLPAIMVLAALAGHLLILRALALRERA
jgi:hypothetical protein